MDIRFWLLFPQIHNLLYLRIVNSRSIVNGTAQMMQLRRKA